MRNGLLLWPLIKQCDLKLIHYMQVEEVYTDRVHETKDFKQGFAQEMFRAEKHESSFQMYIC